MTRFRPCIDLHAGSVKQIVGGTLSTTSEDALKTNFTSEHPSAYYASLYKEHNLTGAHVIMLGPGNDAAAKEALAAWPGGMQVGGGITEKNAAEWIEAGADKVRFSGWFLGSIAPKVSFRRQQCSSREANHHNYPSVGNNNLLPLPRLYVLAPASAIRTRGPRKRQIKTRY
jgi:phosphoribosylformimino-5-aminoimidazole carboxamide ribotide isomerase